MKITNLNEIIISDEEQLQGMFDAITDPILIVNRDFKILRLNMAAHSLIDENKTLDEFIGRYCYEVFHGKDSVCDKCLVEGFINSQQSLLEPWLVEFVKNNTRMTYDVSIFPKRCRSGIVNEVVLYLKDVTRSAQLETELYDVERSRLLESIALGLAHEIRNPLSVISSTAQYLRDASSENIDTFNDMEIILRNVNQVNNIIVDLLNFAKPREMSVENVDLKYLLEVGYRLVKKELAKHSVSVKIKASNDIPWVRLNQQNFIQAYINFLLNAADTMPNGGEIYVEVELIKPENIVQIRIEDTGKGFSPEVMPRLFKPFLRTKGGINSLRMPIALEIIKNHGGIAEFQSVEGKGSMAVIKLNVG